MPDRATVEAFSALVEAGQFVEAIEQYYTPGASMQENGGPPRIGRDVLVEAEKRTIARNLAVTCQRLGPILIDGNQVAIRWRFAFTTRDGKDLELDEIAWQTWEGDKIASETFFYDPAQLTA